MKQFDEEATNIRNFSHNKRMSLLLEKLKSYNLKPSKKENDALEFYNGLIKDVDLDTITGAKLQTLYRTLESYLKLRGWID